MRLKPKMTNLNKRALLYKRFTDIQESFSTKVVYQTFTDSKTWIFDFEKLEFTEVQPATDSTVIVVRPNNCLSYIKQGTEYRYRYEQGAWGTTEAQNLTLLSSQYNNIGKYQTNKYYYAGSFDWVKKGAIEGSTTQYIKGNIMPLTSFSIQYYNDDIDIMPDDLVVIDNGLYYVQNPVEDHKHLPKDFAIYSADLISII